ncbi:MAG: Asp-tRNA(Asn)/Glu-tRNA(Gln) amidotransferase GatCAB subunit B, partial [Clostridia bacterium]|nr:Asp-tRNA(Asn)/Glu-tRNA(Gln) amidotransferase GatCAB subunit B [Clostridia bacterium]
VHLAAESGEDPAVIVGRESMLKISDEDALAPYVDAAISASEKAVADYRRGKVAAIRQILGTVMRESGGRADPLVAGRMLEERLKN